MSSASGTSGRDTHPDTFVRMIRRAQRGKLKVYLGYAAGVGKTFQMLEEAHRLRAEGIDVVVGYVETHGRAATAALLDGLETIPRQSTVYRGVTVEEMDLDAVIARRPHVVLVDELAHTNVPGSRNAKRYEDIDEILDRGIHVISTLNVQHLESLFDAVERATQVKVRERIPDRVLLDADEVVNVDLSSEDLRERVREGKVYTSERIETALDHFFKSSNLDQLRELTLRELASQIDARRRGPLAEEIGASPDQVMVCLSSRGPNSEALLRYASRLAGRLNRNWYAVYVQTTLEGPTVIDAGTQRTLSNTLTLAQQLGATVFTYKGDDVVRTILQFAREYRVGHIVVGSPGSPLSYWERLLGRKSIVERLVLESEGVTVVVLDTHTVPSATTMVAGEVPPPSGRQPDIAAVHLLTPSFWKRIPVLIWNDPIEKVMALRQLMEACLPDDTTLRRDAWRRLLERETQGGTFVGEDTAIPHARIAGLETPHVALAVAKAGAFDADAGRSARILILLLSPETPPNAHVGLLGAISRIAQNDLWRRDVQRAGSADQVREVTLDRIADTQ